MRRRHALAALFVSGILGLACVIDGVTFENNPSTPQTPKADAGTGTPARDASNTEIPDVESPFVDSGISEPVVDSSSRFCTTPLTHFQCLDFDDGVLPPGWTNEQNGNGTASVVNKALESKINGGLASNAACLSIALGNGRTAMTVEADVTFLAFGSVDFDIFEVGFDGEAVALEIQNDGRIAFDLENGGNETVVPFASNIGTGTVRMKLEVLTAANLLSISIFRNGVKVGATTTNANAFDPGTRLGIGDCSMSQGSNWHVRLDNVLVDVR